MTTAYEYVTFRVERGAWGRMRADVFGEMAAELATHGGRIFGLFAGLVGFASDEGVLIRTWPNADVMRQNAPQTMAATSVFVEWRPVDAAPPARPGMYAHRWFWVRTADWDEFARLSEREIWPFFESDGCHIIGLWRADDGDLLKALLITRYDDVTHWERTRLQQTQPPAGADAALYRRAQDAARQRAAITQRSIVRFTRILLPGEGG